MELEVDVVDLGHRLGAQELVNQTMYNAATTTT
jgi:hypothetical protein